MTVTRPPHPQEPMTLTPRDLRRLPATSVRASTVARALDAYRTYGPMDAARVAGVTGATVAAWARALGIQHTVSSGLAAAHRRRSRDRHGPDLAARLCAAYATGEETREIVARFGVSWQRFYRTLAEAGMPLRGRGHTGTPRRTVRVASRRRYEARQMRADGHRTVEIAARLGVHTTTVDRYLRCTR